MNKLFLPIFIVLILVLSCTRNRIDVKPIPKCDGTEASYSKDIKPLIKAKCSTGLGAGTGCHDSWILTYDGIMNKVNNNTFKETTILNKTMPKVPNNFGIDPLTEDEINLIICWLDNGAKEN
ncbi:MAG: hypothetical protein P1U41_06100 [Vicingaceae bacterium]|nr:hypothetical protein [Vicingaceae bacterium]